MPAANAWRLINSASLEAVPAALARARGNGVARCLAGGDWLIRRKHDGRYLASLNIGGRGSHRCRLIEPANLARIDRAEWLELVERAGRRHPPTAGDRVLPLTGVRRRLMELGIGPDYGERHALSLIPEPGELRLAGFDRYRRPLWLLAAAARAWQALHRAATREGVALDVISGYRSHDYQVAIIRRKLGRGQTIDDILRVNAAPGYSEHHSGRALDIGCPGQAPADIGFETTPAFAWLREHGARFGFRLSYPRDNPHGIDYEPWHWCWQPCPLAGHAGSGRSV